MGFNPYYPRTWRKDNDSESEILGKSQRSNMTGKRKWLICFVRRAYEIIWGFCPSVITYKDME